MRVALLQTSIAWCDSRANIAEAGLLAGKADADLYILPEMWDSGFDIEARTASSENESEALEWMKTTAKAKNAAVAGSLIIKDGGKTVNRFFFVTPSGIEGRYDKRHLFRFGGETKRISNGESRAVVTWRGVRFFLATCYDLRFPVWMRNRLREGKAEYDVALTVASWPVSRIDSWEVLLKARAIENQCIMVGCNRVGSDPYCEYTGHSMAVNAYGQSIGDAGEKQGVTVMELPLEHLEEFREKFFTIEDGDKFKIEI